MEDTLIPLPEAETSEGKPIGQGTPRACEKIKSDDDNWTGLLVRAINIRLASAEKVSELSIRRGAERSFIHSLPIPP